jgi:hypothetical protein
MKITRRQLRQIIKENGDTDPSDGWPSTRPDTSDPEYNPLRPSTPPPDPDELDFSEEGGLIDYERMKKDDREQYDALINHKPTDREFRLDRDLLPFAKDAAAEEKIKKAIAKAKAEEAGLKKENTIKITRKQLRQIIKETLDADLLKGAYVSSREDREAFKDYIAKVKEKRMSMSGLGPADDHLESITSQDMADAKRYAKSDLPRDQADYLDISVEDWYRIRQEIDDHYEDRHMEDQMAFDDDPDLDDDGMLSVGELVKMTQNIADDASESNVQEGTETSQMPASWQQILGTCLD